MIVAPPGAIERLRAEYPGREICGRCLMSFVRNQATEQAGGPMRCPDCGRRFWCGLNHEAAGASVICYTAGHWPEAR